jgi:hypothetical protein
LKLRRDKPARKEALGRIDELLDRFEDGGERLRSGTPCCGIGFLGDSWEVKKYEGGKSASGARQSRCDVGAW